ncbi:MAG: hypothetical protein A2W91_05040 [Bacteroidetes bacterium GWF2_38_335]|nr:MAG: hypothetical protein A2W91_05040 [Bacteroidetes bacterium GWF2_38_335]OFY79803.1 MAG: hypothetical protein A2281_10380 [Bacteroidetes bacterium RIFOXYA12_FULL_38_20]HBS88192.1 hypothetical protein [Bacteroidales bacterium]
MDEFIYLDPTNVNEFFGSKPEKKNTNIVPIILLSLAVIVLVAYNFYQHKKNIKEKEKSN